MHDLHVNWAAYNLDLARIMKGLASQENLRHLIFQFRKNKNLSGRL